MRISPLHDILAAQGASFEERYGIEIVSAISDSSLEYDSIRNRAGLTDFSFMQKFTIPEETSIDFLDSLFAGNVAKVRFGRMLHTFLADDNGHVIADCYVANNDEEFILLCESIVDDAALREIFKKHGAAEAGLQDCTESHIALSIDGYKAWSVAKDMFGIDVLGLPYLSIEMYSFDDTEIRFFRAGKTSEFGYLLLAPKEIGEKLFNAALEAVKKFEGALCSVSIHNDLRLEGRFFNIYAEGVSVQDPLSLGLQWMIDFDKDSFVGFDAIIQRRGKGLSQKIIGISTEAALEELAPGTGVYDGAEQVATVQASCYSPTLKGSVGLALFPVDIAYAGLTFNLGSTEGPEVRTISMPPIMPRSLTVKLDDM